MTVLCDIARRLYLCRRSQRVFFIIFLCLCLAIFFWRHLRTDPIYTSHTITYLFE
jgi:hypothetical protein